MKYYSTKNKNKFFSAKEAVIKGLPEDNGLFFPEKIHKQTADFFSALHSMSLPEIGFRVLAPYFQSDIPEDELITITSKTFDFPIPVVEVEKGIHSLELFHGPTLAFKDIGARFLAGCLNYFATDYDRKALVLVATSGDTGSAVANGFFGTENVDVVILFPKGKISDFQEKQMTTLGGNIRSIEIEGTFDDCQKLVKTAFLDKGLNEKLMLTSANSINIARFIPQSIYFFHALSQLNTEKQVVVSVPSGNYGNLTAGVFANEMGLPIKRFIASSNINDIVPKYLSSGEFNPRPSIRTISNAMDVGDPSNFVRLLEVYKNHENMTASIVGASYTDEETRRYMKKVYKDQGYIMDPHGSVGYAGLKDFLKGKDNFEGIFLETAHPIKFRDVVEEELSIQLDMPEQGKKFTGEPSKELMDSDFSNFKEFLLSNY